MCTVILLCTIQCLTFEYVPSQQLWTFLYMGIFEQYSIWTCSIYGKYTKALMTRLEHEEDDYIGGTKRSTKESDEEPGMLTEIQKKRKNTPKSRHDPRVQMGDDCVWQIGWSQGRNSSFCKTPPSKPIDTATPQLYPSFICKQARTKQHPKTYCVMCWTWEVKLTV